MCGFAAWDVSLSVPTGAAGEGTKQELSSSL